MKSSKKKRRRTGLCLICIILIAIFGFIIIKQGILNASVFAAGGNETALKKPATEENEKTAGDVQKEEKDSEQNMSKQETDKVEKDAGGQDSSASKEQPAQKSEASDAKEQPAKPAESSSSAKKMVENPDDILVLVNKEWNLPSDYVPKDLVVPNVAFSFSENLPKKQMRKEAAAALEELFGQAKKDGINLLAASGYRSYNTQKSIFQSNAKLYGEKEANKTSAYPGQSEHQTGLAMDLTCAAVGYQLTESFGETAEGKWLKEHASEYGFIIRYAKSKEEITGYSYEPWHIRYVGKEVAREIDSQGLAYEEYYNRKLAKN